MEKHALRKNYLLFNWNNLKKKKIYIFFLRFVPYTNQANWIRIFSGTGCYSNVGKNTAAGEQTVSIAKPGCVYTGIIAHELNHALGIINVLFK